MAQYSADLCHFPHIHKEQQYDAMAHCFFSVVVFLHQEGH